VGGGYTYLVNIPIYTFSKEEIQKLEDKLKELKLDLEYIKSQTSKSIFINDINSLGLATIV
jgi:hypothetical protein